MSTNLLSTKSGLPQIEKLPVVDGVRSHPLVVRHANGHLSITADTVTVICAKSNNVDPAITLSGPLGADLGA